MSNNTIFKKRAFDMAAYSNVRSGNYQEAISYYETIIAGNPDYQDSIYAVIDAGLAYYDAFLYLEGGDGPDGALVSNTNGATTKRVVDNMAGDTAVQNKFIG